MWKTNSAQARANIRQYIRKNTDFSGCSALEMIDPQEACFSSLAVDILNVFRTEKRYAMNKYNEFQFTVLIQGGKTNDQYHNLSRR